MLQSWEEQAADRQWIERPQLDDEIPGHQQRAGREQHIARQAHPLPEKRRVVEGAAAGIGQAVLIDGVELRPADREKVEQYP